MNDPQVSTLALIDLVIAYKEGKLTAEQLGKAIKILMQKPTVKQQNKASSFSKLRYEIKEHDKDKRGHRVCTDTDTGKRAECPDKGDHGTKQHKDPGLEGKVIKGLHKAGTVTKKVASHVAKALTAKNPKAKPPSIRTRGAIAVASAMVSGAAIAAKKIKEIGALVYEDLPPPAKCAVNIGLAIEHSLVHAYKSAQELAKAVAKEKGYPEDHVDRVARVLATADGISRWTANVPGAHSGIDLGVEAGVHAVGHAAHEAMAAVGGPVGWAILGVAKLGYYIPVASLTYVGYHAIREVASGKNPFKLIKSAREQVKLHHQSKPKKKRVKELDE